MTDPQNLRSLALYEHAKTRIPGGTQLLSKRPEMFLPGQWPAYYSKAKGCEIWDLDGRRFIDVSLSAVGACPLGYADDDVNAAVKQCIDNGSMSTLNAPAEVELADLLCEIHPWARMARYARTGGEAMAIAVRIARAFSGRDKVAVCGYHGWSDWYLAANLGEDTALDGHLLPGLDPAGVPRGLRGTALTFRYNHIEDLEAIVEKHGPDIGAIVMEPVRYQLPADGFLQKVREIATRIGAVLVFDEITAGWRMCFGGAHLMLDVEPDVAVFAKSMSNGFPMAAVIGTAEVMQAAQSTFISSTYWTEAVGPTAALATIRKCKQVDLSGHTNRTGKLAHEGWQQLAKAHNLDITIEGLPPLSHFSLNYGERSQTIRTLLTQLMLDSGYLATNAFYVTYAHTAEMVQSYLEALNDAFAILSQAIRNDDIEARLRGPVAHSGFKRLT